MSLSLRTCTKQNGFFYFHLQSDTPIDTNAVISSDVLFIQKSDETSYCACRTVRANEFSLIAEVPEINAPIILRITIQEGEALSEKVLSISRKQCHKALQMQEHAVETGTELVSDALIHALFFAPKLMVDTAIADTERTIVRGIVSVPDTSVGTPNIRLLSAQGTSIPTRVLVKGKTLSSLSCALTADAVDFPFSVDIPSDGSCAYFEITFKDNPAYDRCFFLGTQNLEKHLQYWGWLNQAANLDPRHDRRVKKHEADAFTLQRQRNTTFSYAPTFSIIVPLFNTPGDLFKAMLASVMQQTYPNWELVLVNASPENEQLAQCVSEAIASDERIKLVALDDNYGITGNTNAGVRVSTGDFVCFFDHDDVLDPSILFEYANAVNIKDNIDLMYCDEDKLFDNNYYGEAFFKPDFSIDMLRNNNYICHMLCIRKTLLDEIGPTPDGFDGAQDHWLTLRASESARRIWHVRKPLYHWRATQNSTALAADSKSYANEAGIRAVSDHLARIGVKAQVTPYGRPFTYRVKYEVEGTPLVSIIIPNKDCIEVLSRCLDSIFQKTNYCHFEIIIVENNSTKPETFAYYDNIQKQHENVHVFTWTGEGFNYPSLNNFGVSHAKGAFLLFLNNDTEVIDGDWLETMLGICMRKEVGAVGVRLLYPDDTYQHAGIGVAGLGAARMFYNIPKDGLGYFAENDMTRNVSAVTAACLMSPRDKFEEVGGFSEQFAVAFNDLDYCLKLREKDYLIVYTADITLYHHESFSRGDDMHDTAKKERLLYEASLLRMTWNSYFAYGDPYGNPNFHQFEYEANYCRLCPEIDDDDYARSPLVQFLAKVYHRLQNLRK